MNLFNVCLSRRQLESNAFNLLRCNVSGSFQKTSLYPHEWLNANKENTSSIIMKIGLVWPIWYGPYGAIEYGPNVLRKLQGFQDLIQKLYHISSLAVYFCSVPQLCLTLCDPMDCSMPGFPVLHHLEFAQTHVHRVNDAIQPYCPLSFLHQFL